MSMSKYKVYAGIGSRTAPTDIRQLMTQIAQQLSGLGWILRSGHAEGSDLAFELGAGTLSEIYLPSPSFNKSLPIKGQAFLEPTRMALAMAAEYHPAWERCSQYARLLHARNMHQILGLKLDSPVRFVLCWTSDGNDTGGTGQAIRLARSRSIPVFNLHHTEARERLERFCARAVSGSLSET